MLLVIGDSHAVIWGGKLVLSDRDTRSLFPGVSVRHLGPALAYNLVAESEGSLVPGKWGNEILKHLKETQGVTAVCLCFGEIDIRTRAVKIAAETGMALNESVERIAGRLVSFCDILRRDFTHPIFVAAPVPSASPGRAWDRSYPAYGSARERNWATRLFTEHLLARSRELKFFHVVSVFDQLADCTLKTRQDLYADEIHLNTRGLGLLVEEFRRVARERNLSLVNYWDPSGIVGDVSSLRDISREVVITVDSAEQTNAMTIDIGYGAFPARLKVLGLRFKTPRLRFALKAGLALDDLAPIGKCEVIPWSEHAVDFEIGLPDSLSCRFLQMSDESSSPFSFADLRLEVKSFQRR